MAVPVYESSYADGAAVDAALDLAVTALQPADVGTAAAEDVGAFATAAQGGKADTAVQPDTPVRLGSVTNYTNIAADGTLTFGGAATYWVDITFPIYIRTTGLGVPVLTTVTGNLVLPQFQVNDYYGSEGNEVPHAAMLGATAHWHIHMLTAAQDATDRYVKWEVEVYYANPSAALVGPATFTMTGDFLIPANTPARTQYLIEIGEQLITGSEPGTYLWPRLKRITATGAAPSADPFVPTIHCHIECDALGSASEYTK